MSHNFWSEERETAVQDLWAQGLSATEIALRLGGLSRNAVLGKVYRLKLAERNERQRETAARPKSPPSPKQRAMPPRTPRPPAAPPTIMVPPPDPERRLLQLQELKPASCRWPIDDAEHGFLFCGAPKDERRSYCPYHAALARSTAPNPHKRYRR